MKFIKYITPALFCAALTLRAVNTSGYEAYGILFGRPRLEPKIDSGRFCIANLQQCPPLLSRYPTEEGPEFGHAPELPNEARDLMNRDWSWGFNQFGTIRRCNLIIEKSQASTGLSDADKKHW